MQYSHPCSTGRSGVCDCIDVRFILDDFFAKIARFARGDQETAKFG